MAAEVASFVAPLDQFQPGHSAYECVAFGCADIYYSGPPAGQPAGNAAQIVNLAEQWYAKEEGSNDSSNTRGMSLGAEYAVLEGLQLHYEPLSGDLLTATREALGRGLPVLICGAEASFFDVVLGRCPYAWQPAGNHCIVATGIAPGGDLYVRDYANSEFFGYRRVYSAARMQLISATAVWPRWMEETMTPANWKDDGTTLTAPNGHKVVLGFRGKVLQGWEASDVPTEEEHGDGTGGTVQKFTRTILKWNAKDGVTVHAPDPAPATNTQSLQAALTQIEAIASKTLSSAA